MVSAVAIFNMVGTLLLCIAVPTLGIILLSRRYPKVWRACAVGALAFFSSQMMLRIPLMTLAGILAPDTVGKFLNSIPVASFSAGIFEETARLIFMILLLKGFYRRADGVAFGLGHGGIEAILLVGMTMVNNIIFAILINMGKWDVLARTMPPETAAEVKAALVDTPSTDFLVGGIERIWAIGLHIVCSLIIMMGVHKGKRLLAWILAVLIHGVTNYAAISALHGGANPWVVEFVGILAVAAVLIAVVKLAGKVLPSALKS